MSKTFHSLSYPNYRLWFISNLVSATGMWMQRVCQIWVVLTVLTNNSAIAVGLVTAFQFLPQMFLGPFGGVLADWVNRRRLIQITQLAVAFIGLAMGLLLVTHTAGLIHVYLAAVLSGIADALSSAVRNTFLSELVPTASLPNAISLNSTSFNIARLFGPALAGLLIELVGPGWVFILNFALFIVPVLALAAMKEEHFFAHKVAERHKGMLREGFAYVRTRSDIVAILVMIAVVSGLGLNFQVTQALMATEVYGEGAGSYGLLGSMLAIGSLSGALFSARRKAPRFSLLLLYAAVFGLVAIAASLAPTYLSFAILMIPTGFTMLTFLIAVNTLVQISTPAHLRGRVLAIYFAVNLGITPIGSPLIGWIGQMWGPRWSIAIGGIGSILIAVIIFIWAKIAWDVELHHLKRWPFVSIYGPRERHVDNFREIDDGLR
ncbi:MFS transporter [Arcanobacterium pinnipediorum]|uniref:MFS transporter n=1 Tax=Arcanobacterium pinnipediorum TaxID=1503041 RepID=A0ABY5AGG1_9ACTO|nr:MFS transporter [Arcanobacterium pinnipediorum]USR79279.1 MFS transporter [Arcanobacterium pinnipediorum]